MSDDGPPMPLVSAEVDLRDYDFIPLYGDRLFNSDTWALCDADEKVAALRLWWRAWHEEPAGSLPDNDRLLAERAGYGVAIKAFLAVKINAMRGWIACSDGRLYHPVVASIALDVWTTKHRKRVENAADRQRKRLKRSGLSAGHNAIVPRTNGYCPPDTSTDNSQIPQDVRVETLLREEKRSEVEGSVGSNEPTAAEAPPDLEKQVYDSGAVVLGARAGGLVKKLLVHVGGDYERALAALDRARKKSNPREYLGAFLRGNGAERADDVLAETDALYRRLGVDL